MQKKIKNILIIALVIATVLLSIFGLKTTSENDKLVRDTEIVAANALSKQHALKEKITEREIEIFILKEEAIEHDSLKKGYVNKANYFKAKYSSLLQNEGVIPENAEDSLKVALIASESLFSENINLRLAIKEGDMIQVAQTRTIDSLEISIEDYKILLSSEKEISKLWRKVAYDVKANAKKEKRNMLFKAGGVGAILGAVAIIVIVK